MPKTWVSSVFSPLFSALFHGSRVTLYVIPSPVISPLNPVGFAGYAKTPCFSSSARMMDFKKPEFLVVCEIPGHNGLGCAAICRDMPRYAAQGQGGTEARKAQNVQKVSPRFTVFHEFSRILTTTGPYSQFCSAGKVRRIGGAVGGVLQRL